MAKKKKAAARVSVQVAMCEVFSTDGVMCPMCQALVPANVHHTCSVDRGVRKVTNRHVNDVAKFLDEM